MTKNHVNNVNESAVFLKDRPKDDFSSLSEPQLLERLERQNKLINSPSLRKLPDKGEKVKLLKKQLEEEVEKRKKTKSDDICNIFTGLSLKEKNIDNLEWGEKNIDKTKTIAGNNNGLDPFGDEGKDPLALIASHSGTTYHKKQIKVENDIEPPSLITTEDLYAIHLCDKLDKIKLPKQKFLPFKTLNSVKPSTHKIRDLSAATPPQPVFGDVKLISLEESLRIQMEQGQHLKEIQSRVAAERLKNSLHKIGSLIVEGESFQSYRERQPEEESGDEDDTPHFQQCVE